MIWYYVSGCCYGSGWITGPGISTYHRCGQKKKKKLWCKDTMQYDSDIKENEVFPFAATWMDLNGIMISEMSQAERDKYCMLLLM